MVASSHAPRSGGFSWCSFLLVLLVGASLAIALGLRTERDARQPAWSEPLRLTILHTNDMHGQVVKPPRGEAGLVALGRAIRQERDRARRDGEAVLVLDAGDFFQGTPEGNLTEGEALVAWMNHVGYDVLAVGNHEFDFGLEVPARLAEQARFPFLAGNIVEEASGRRPAWLGREPRQSAQAEPLRGAAVVRSFEQQGVRFRVAVVGLTTSAMKDVTVKGATDGLRFTDEAECLTRVLTDLPPVDLVVLLTHCGLDTDRELARRFQGKVDVIVGGHSHTRLSHGEQVGDVLVVQAGDKTWNLGRVRVRLSPPMTTRSLGERPTPRDAVVSAEADLVPAGDDLDAVLAPFVEQVEVRAAAEVGHLSAPLSRAHGYASSNLGNLQTDLMRALTGADVALQNKTGIRDQIDQGPVTWREVYQVSPFGNTVVTMKLRGADLLDLLEGMLVSPARLFELSGVRVVCDPGRPEGKRLLEATVDGAPIDPAREYLVATNNFLAPGGDGHVAFTRGVDLKNTGHLLRDLLIEHLRAKRPYDPGQPEQRIVVPN